MVSLLDDEGRLFGVANVVDVLVVVFVLALVGVGAATLGGFSGDSPNEVRYATLALGEHPTYVAEQVTAGDVAVFEGTAGTVTVTDVHLTPGRNGTARVIVRATVNGALQRRAGFDDRVFAVGGQPVRRGATLDLETAEYGVAGTVTDVERTGSTLPATEESVVVEATVPAAVAASVSAGDEYRLAGRTVATVAAVDVYPTGRADRRRLRAELSLRTTAASGDARFAGRRLAAGATLPFEGPDYAFAGRVLRRGHLDDAATGTTRAVVRVAGTSPEVAAALRPGLTETVRGETLARVVEASDRPTRVTLRSDDGNIYAREHPAKRDVTLTVDLRTRETASGPAFHGRPLRVGNTVVLEFGTVTVEATVVSVGG